MPRGDVPSMRTRCSLSRHTISTGNDDGTAMQGRSRRRGGPLAGGTVGGGWNPVGTRRCLVPERRGRVDAPGGVPGRRQERIPPSSDLSSRKRVAGREVESWQRVTRPNDTLDGAIYARVAAQHAGWDRWTAADY